MLCSFQRSVVSERSSWCLEESKRRSKVVQTGSDHQWWPSCSSFCGTIDGAARPRLPDHGPVCPSCPGEERPTRGCPERSAPGLRHEDAVQGAAQPGTASWLLRISTSLGPLEVTAVNCWCRRHFLNAFQIKSLSQWNIQERVVTYRPPFLSLSEAHKLSVERHLVVMTCLCSAGRCSVPEGVDEERWQCK